LSSETKPRPRSWPTLSIVWRQLYTPWDKKAGQWVFVKTLPKYWSIFKLLSLAHFQENLQQALINDLKRVTQLHWRGTHVRKLARAVQSCVLAGEKWTFWTPNVMMLMRQQQKWWELYKMFIIKFHHGAHKSCDRSHWPKKIFIRHVILAVTAMTSFLPTPTFHKVVRQHSWSATVITPLQTFRTVCQCNNFQNR